MHHLRADINFSTSRKEMKEAVQYNKNWTTKQSLNDKRNTLMFQHIVSKYIRKAKNNKNDDNNKN